MNILFTSMEGNAYPLGMEMMEEGHEVKVHILKPQDRKMGNGFVPKTKDWEAELEWADLVICDDTGFGKQNDAIRRMGIPVVGGTALSDALEENRGAGQRMFKALGMETLKSMDFKTIKEAIKYVQDNPKRYVVKVSGQAQKDKSTTYVGECEDGKDVEAVLFHMEQTKGASVGVVEVQDCVQGVEVAIGGFFNGQEFLDPVFVNFEHKKFFPSRTEQSGMGPATSEMGTIGCWKDKGFKLYRETLERFVPILANEGYRGYFDINCIIETRWVEDPEIPGLSKTSQVIRPLEMTNRFGWPTILMQMETMKINDLGELFHGIATGTMSDFKVSDHYSACVVITVPPAPYESQEIASQYSEGMPIIFRRPEECDGIYPSDVYFEKGQWKLFGDLGFPCVCCAGADSIEEAQMKAYSKVANIIVANKMYREDIGDLIPMKLSQISSLLEYQTERV